MTLALASRLWDPPLGAGAEPGLHRNRLSGCRCRIHSCRGKDSGEQMAMGPARGARGEAAPWEARSACPPISRFSARPG